MLSLLSGEASAQGIILQGDAKLSFQNAQSCTEPPALGYLSPLVDCDDLTMYTWGQSMKFQGSGWYPNENVSIYMYGPLNTPGVVPKSRLIGKLPTSSDGTLGTFFNTVGIPYDGGTTGLLGVGLPDIPAPGLYAIKGVGDNASSSNAIKDRAYAGNIRLVPQPLGAAYNGGNLPPRWERSRGSRLGLFGDDSPERVDPEWISVWSKKPVSFYATVALTDLNGNNQSAFISHQEYPGTHYAHDLNLELVPDPDYRWILGTNNFSSPVGQANHGRIELEWETQNAGNPFTYGQGNIGIPLWATPTAGDRVFAVGRWDMDNGHPDSGDRTEIHPARMLATMRQRKSVVPMGGAMTRASQVDIYVSGHGGGSNQYYDGLEDLLDNHGLGGGRIEDYMADEPGSSVVYDTYYHAGPKMGSFAEALIAYFHFDVSADAIWSVAGPSAMATDYTGLPSVWAHTPPIGYQQWVYGPEERPINDMDYDFDVDLPPPPPGASQILAEISTHAEHTTGVNEVITYRNTDGTSSLPNTAHIHLPYTGADNGIYARTIKFYWDTFSLPGEHFVVQIAQINNTNVYDSYPAPWNVWTDVCGQWLYLSGLRPSPYGMSGFVSKNGDVINFNSANFDVYLDPTDQLRVFTFGYEVHTFELLFGITRDGTNQTLLPAYQVGFNLAQELEFGSGDNGQLGGALFTAPASPIDPLLGSQNIAAALVPIDSTYASPSQFNVTFTVSHVPTIAPLTIAANNVTQPYGTPIPALTATYTGFINGESANVLTGTLTCTTAATKASPVGTYPIVCGGQTSPNYVITFVPGTLTITPVPVTITANNATRAYGQPNPVFTASYSGFVNGETPSGLSLTFVCLSPATPASPVSGSPYPINCGGLISTNYAITYVPGALTITKVAPVLTWNSPAPIAFGTPLGAAQLNATANVPGTFTYVPPAGTVLPAGSNLPLAVTFAPADAVDYTAATASVTINVTSLSGDVNGDGIVNCADVAIVRAALGKRRGQPGYDPRADVNGDGVVNFRDLSVILRHLQPGTRCP